MTGPGVLCRFQNQPDVLISETGDDRRDVDANRDSALSETTNHFNSTPWRGHLRLDRACVLLIPKRNADAHAHSRPPRQRLQDVEISFDQRGLGDDCDRVSIFGANLEALAGQPQRGFQWLIAIRHAAENQQVALPRPALKSLAKQLSGTRLDHDFRFKVCSGAEAEVLVGWARIAIGAGMHAAAVWIHAEGEADVRTVIVRDDLARVVLVYFQLSSGRFPEIVDLGALPGVGRIGDRARLHRTQEYD